MADGSKPAVDRVLIASVVGNALVCSVKIAGGLLSGSTALLADGSDSILNVVSSALAYRFRREAEKPPDFEHPYGHSLLEVYGSLLIVILMVATFSFIGYMALDRLMHGELERVDPIGVLFATVSLALNLTVSTLLRILGRGSVIARAESRHVSFDVFEGLLTLTGVALGAHVSALFDIAATFALLALVAFTVFLTLRELRGFITAESPPENLVREIERALASVEGVKGVHQLRVRQAADTIFADVHLEVERGITIEEAHRISEEAERNVKERLGNVDIVVHIEPEGEG
ncbi:MAG: cation diffusion facilitator family transporter [Thermofilaceae archaeon]